MNIFLTVANAGAPLMVYVMHWPLLWLLLIPIVIIEAFAAKKIIGISTSHALVISAFANAASTAIGVPLSWYAMVPDAGSTRSVALTAVFFLVPAFFLSVFSEWLVALLLVRGENRRKAARWSWRANLYTYEGMIVLLLIVVLFDRLR